MSMNHHPHHIVLFPSAGIGHLIPFIELTKGLVLNHGFTATIIVFTDFSCHAQSTFIDTLPSGFSSVFIPSIPLEDLPDNTKLATRLATIMDRSVPHLRDILFELTVTKRGIAAYIPDIFGAKTIITAKQLNIPSYLFFTLPLSSLSLLVHLPILDKSTSCEYRDLPEPVLLPGCIPMKGEDLINSIQDRSDVAYNVMLDISSMITQFDGILVNSFVEIELGPYKALKEKEHRGVLPPLRTVGPLISNTQTLGEDSEKCLNWLDNQPQGSVIFVSFGSGGTLSSEQLNELAYGLEASGQRFLWVLRRPDNTKSNGTYFNLDGNVDVLSCLPDGFLERTRDVGLVIPNWAPQVNVLNHAATGGFVSHCGWNSVLESAMAGVPLIAWPLFAEQRMNAVMLSEGAGVALRLKAAKDGIFGREEIGRVMKELTEGEGGNIARKKMRQIRDAGIAAVDEGGASFEAIVEIAEKLKSSTC